MCKETATNQPKPALVFIDEASVSPSRPGFGDILSHPNYQVYITSSRIEETRSQLHGLVCPHQILPVIAVQSQEHLRQGIKYQPALASLFTPRTNLRTELREKLSEFIPQIKTPHEKPWDNLVIFGQQAARPIDTGKALFIQEDQQYPTPYNLMMEEINILRARAVKQGRGSVLGGWEQYGIGDTYQHEIRGFIHTYEQTAKNGNGELIHIPTLEIRQPYLLCLNLTDVSSRTSKPTPV